VATENGAAADKPPSQAVMPAPAMEAPDNEVTANGNLAGRMS